jgi:hypothetical protein
MRLAALACLGLAAAAPPHQADDMANALQSLCIANSLRFTRIEEAAAQRGLKLVKEEDSAVRRQKIWLVPGEMEPFLLIATHAIAGDPLLESCAVMAPDVTSGAMRDALASRLPGLPPSQPGVSGQLGPVEAMQKMTLWQPTLPMPVQDQLMVMASPGDGHTGVTLTISGHPAPGSPL